MSLSKKTVVISEFMDEDAVQLLCQHFHVVYKPALVDDRTTLHHELRVADALIVRNRTQVDSDLLEAGSQLRVIGRLGVGLDNIDLKSCQTAGITVIPATGANSRAVAEYVITSAMLLLRGCFFASYDVAQGAWPRPGLSSGRETHGKTLGVVGFGGIGQLVARLAHGLGMTVIAHDPHIPLDASLWAQAQTAPVTLDDLVAKADVISLHIPLAESSRGLFNADIIAKMKSGSVLVNTSRGGIVDENALAGALRSGHLAGAALDVFSQEPLPQTPEFDGVPGLVLTPHVAGVTQESNERVSTLIAHSIIEHLK